MNTDDLKEASWNALRPSVRRFAFHMEAVLRRNDHKPGWENDTLPDLWYRLEEETKELADAIMVPERSSGSRIRDEAVDVANFAMMIFDNTLPGPMPNLCVEVGPPSSNFEMKKSVMQLTLDALKRFNETGGVDCRGLCFYIHDPDKPSYVMSAWAPEGHPLYGDGSTYKRAKPIIDIDNNTMYSANKPEYIGSLKNLDDATLKGRRGTRLYVTGLAQARDVERVYNKDLTVREFIPKETHYLLHLESPTGKFDAEVTKKVWDEHVLPAWQNVVMHCDVATANLEGVKKMELFSSPFEEWWSKEGWDATAESKAAMKEAFEAGRKSVLGELDPKDER